MQIWSGEWKRTVELSLYIETGGGNIPELVYVAVIVFTAFFDALSYMIRWYLDMEKADIINRKIAEHRKIINGVCK